MTKKLLVKKERKNYFYKEIRLFKEPEEMKAILHKTRWEILHLLEAGPRFPAEIARKLQLHEQKIYYHIRQLVKERIIEVAYEKEIRGAKAKCYKLVDKVFGIELTPKEKGEKLIVMKERAPNGKLRNFFKEFIKEGQFDGLIVVGAPDPHGPLKTRARDGHYAIQLGMFLGQFLPPAEDMIVKLDVEIRAEKKLDQNLILIGGPAVNLVTAEMNSRLEQPAFDKQMSGIAPAASFGQGIISKKTGTFYSQNNVGVIIKTTNPFQQNKTIIAFAGQGRRGTKATILAMTRNWEELLKDYTEGAFRAIVEGFDYNGDGAVDAAEIIE
ncbi:MAG: helix-turn-helix domain-containing protein [Candidatus Heimdallarchaeota archaeon]|nr:MAG: hypothetical protein DRP02_10500 [Candidatus Gerdarchaeota archaeon]